MTVRFVFPWTKKREAVNMKSSHGVELANEIDYGPPVGALQGESPRQPYRPPHPCEGCGHSYTMLNKSKNEILVFCPRCLDVARIPIKLPASAPASRSPRFAHLA